MNSTEALRRSIKFSDPDVKLLAEMRDFPLLRTRPSGGHHAMWIAGHLAVAEGRLHKMLRGIPNPVESWKPQFDWGSEPVDELNVYPPFDEVVAKLQKLRTATLALIDEVGEEGLNKPTKCQPPGLNGFETVGSAILTIACHACGHLGELSILRAAANKPRAFVPSAELRAF